MTDELKNKLTERFEFLAKRSEEQVSADIYDALLEAYLAGGEYGYQYAQEHPAWVSVEKELPRETGWYLVATPTLNSKIDVALWDGKWFRLVTITHWMPLPTPPMKGGNK